LKSSIKINVVFSLCTVAIMYSTSTHADATSDFTAWKAKTNEAFQTYKDERDQVFIDAMADSWREIDMFAGKVRDEVPKLPDIPVAEYGPNPQVGIDNIPAALSIPQTAISPEPTNSIGQSLLKGRVLDVPYFGHNLIFEDSKPLRATVRFPLSQTSISDVWSHLSQLDYEIPLARLLEYDVQLDLADWAQVQLVWNYVDADVRRKHNDKVLLAWFLLAKQGFDAKIAFDKNFVYLLMPSDQPIYGAAYYTVAGIQYYWVDLGRKGLKPNRATTFEGKYPDADRSLDMRFTKTIAPTGKDYIRKVKFEFNQRHYELDIAFTLNRVQYYQTYPQIDLNYYFESQLYPRLSQNIVEQLKPMMANFNEKEAVDFLLKLVQQGFEYGTDAKQFGEENYLLPEEMFFYPLSDCEDRSILFAWLVRNLTGLDVVSLNYPGHVATAVAFKGKVDGDSIVYKGKRYTVADPTYMNARSGMTMPKFRAVTPKIHSVL
jgi:hypothetical protein